jgi:hypothetical protein
MPKLDDFMVGQPIDAPGRTGHLIDKRPHVRLDGTPTGILTWRVRCVHPECTTEFDATSGLSMSTDSLRKHCDDHRLTPAQYLAKGRAKRRENVQVQRAVKKQAKAAERERMAAEKEARKAARADAMAQLRTVPGNTPSGRRKLSDADVAEIRKLSEEGFSSGDLALVFPVSGSQIRNILGGRRRA